MTNDIINGLFELGGAFANVLSIKALWRDKVLKGVHWAPTFYFFSWGVWNTWWYPSLGQWYSFFGAIAILVTNFIWIASIIWFYFKGKHYD